VKDPDEDAGADQRDDELGDLALRRREGSTFEMERRDR
jgi:hypothetical protein